MKFCDTHWQALRTAIDIRGLSHLVARNGKEAVERAKDELMGVETDDTYDPLMAANWMISGRALECGGLYLMGKQSDGSEFCPLCEVEKHVGVGTAQTWIDGCTDSIKEHCKERKLI